MGQLVGDQLRLALKVVRLLLSKLLQIWRRDDNRYRVTDRRGPAGSFADPRPAWAQLLAPRPRNRLRRSTRDTGANQLRRHSRILRAPHGLHADSRRAPLHATGARWLSRETKRRHAHPAHPRARRARAAVTRWNRRQLRARRAVR